MTDTGLTVDDEEVAQPKSIVTVWHDDDGWDCGLSIDFGDVETMAKKLRELAELIEAPPLGGIN